MVVFVLMYDLFCAHPIEFGKCISDDQFYESLLIPGRIYISLQVKIKDLVFLWCQKGFGVISIQISII